ncbi:hypothetical protein JR311_19275 [Bacillus velezensis]|nr:hypothetical protein [Bacillus velezensis]QRV09334.1 hypothetical protein JR311_19275 [Bacillus velezensis]
MNADKKREIQRKYKEQMRRKKVTYTVEAVVVTAIVVLIIFLNCVIKGF